MKAPDPVERRVQHRRHSDGPDETQQLVKRMVECVADGLLLVNAAGKIQFANPAAAELFGRSADALADTEFGFPIVAGETAEIELVRPGGRLITAELRVSELPWGSDHALLVSLRDITERKESEEAARQFVAEKAKRQQAEAAEERAARLAEVSRLLASSLDYETTLCSVADAVVPTLGDWCAVDILIEDGTTRRLATRHSDPQKVRWAEDIHSRYPPDPDAPIGVPNVLRTGKPEFYPQVTDELLVQVAKDADHLALLQGIGFRSAIIVPLIARGRTLGAITLACEKERCFEKGDLVIAEDLASRGAVAVDNARLYQEARAAEAEAERARAQAESANESKSAFLAMMSHELRTPLNAIGGYAQLMEDGISGPVTDKQREYLKRVRVSQAHLEALINDVLNFAKLEAGRLDFEFSEFTLADGLSTIVTLVDPQITAKELTFEYRGGDSALVVHADREKVVQIILNLVSNAVKFTAPGGLIILDWIGDHEHAHIRVSDTGAGIPPEKLDAVFEPFVQADRNVHGASHGTGLGLTISRDLARRMGGDITVESEVGNGSTFTLTLPVPAASQKSREPILAA